MVRRPRLIEIVVLAALATGVAVAAQAPPPSVSVDSLFRPGPADALIHRASGFVFPASLADMPRRRLRAVAADDVIVQYTLRGGGNGDPWLDVIVYPAGRSVAEEAEGVEGAMLHNRDLAAVAAPAPLPAAARDGRGGWFHGRSTSGRCSAATRSCDAATGISWFAPARPMRQAPRACGG